MQRFLLALISLLVPSARRHEWREEWAAELEHFARRHEAAGHSWISRRAMLFLYTIDALEDAMGMWMRGWTRAMAGLGREVRFGLRGVVRNPAFSVMAVLTLALGIGANAAIFSVVRSAVLRPLPYPSSDELVRVVLRFAGGDHGPGMEIPLSEPEFLELRDGVGDALRLAGYWTADANLGGGERPERVGAAAVSSNFLDVLGVDVALGRDFAAEETRPGNADVAILSHDLWRRTFGADPGLVGRTVRINGRPRTVVGVLPASFEFPGADVEVLRPNTIDPASPAGRSSHYIQAIARVAPGTSPETARRRVDAWVERWNEANPGLHGPSPGHPYSVVSLHERLVGDVKPALSVLFGAVFLVLLIACANVASLMLVRAEHRRGELGLRAALGAGRAELARTVLAESAVVAVLGGTGGLALAYGGVSLLDSFAGAALRLPGEVRVDLATLLFTLGASVFTLLLFGVVPAVTAARRAAAGRLQAVGRERAPSGSPLTVRGGLVVTEVALAVMLVIASGLLVKSFDRLSSVDPGFRASGVVTVDFALDAAPYPEPADLAAFHRRLEERLLGVPGVVATGTVRSLPFWSSPGWETMIPTDQAREEDEHWNAHYQIVSPGYFETMSIPVVDGRGFTRSDRADAPPVAVVNRAMAEAYWPDGSPLGRRLKLGVEQIDNPELTVVGVVGNVRQGGLDDEETFQLFVPRAQAGAIYGGLGTRFATLVVKSELAPAVAMETIRRAVAEIDPTLPLADFQTMEEVVERSLGSQRLLAWLVGLFSVLALVLGATGIAGLVAYLVTRRTREIGVRLALGAARGRVLRHVMRGVLVLAVVGVGVGLLAGLGATRALEGQLFQVSSHDPLVFATAPLVLLGVAALAAYLPARRATRVDPSEALRAE